MIRTIISTILGFIGFIVLILGIIGGILSLVIIGKIGYIIEKGNDEDLSDLSK